DPPEVGKLGNLAYDHAFGRASVGGECGNGSDHHRFGVLGREAGRAQPLREVGRAIVPVQLPLEGLAALGEDPDLPRDQLVELLAVEAGEVTVLDPSAAREAERA